MDVARRETRALTIGSLLACSAIGVTAVFLFAPADRQLRSLLADAAVLWATLVSGAVITRHGGTGGEWRSGRTFGAAFYCLAGLSVLFLFRQLSGSEAFGPGLAALAILPVGVIFLLPIRTEFADHFAQEDRREIAADVALVTAAIGCVAYVAILPSDAGTVAALSAAAFAVSGTAMFTTYGALALWVPTPAHIGQFLVMATMAGATFATAIEWVRGEYRTGQIGTGLPVALGALALATLVSFLPPRMVKGSLAKPTRWGRPLLTATAVAAACAALAVVANREIGGGVGAVEAPVMIAVLATAVAIRILLNQVRSAEATRQVQVALAQKEVALAETDRALDRLRRANETLRDSEERLRTVFEAAVDCIVELDEHDLILQANEAFCRMVELPKSLVEGQPWTAIAVATKAVDDSFASLPKTGEGTLRREGHDLYLEARTSDIPGDPPRRLLLVRDVTAARVADQTIRSLFKFLQDRDEDRTRIMRRTNAAIETERNRIARDLHDGPVQGVSAASLSLEAVLLMLKGGDVDEGVSVLAKVRQELSEEADNLRQLMSGLRPPLLEERGLIPAIRETLVRFGNDTGFETEFNEHGPIEVPPDIETLAYRIVQEALSNAGKHSQASKVAVSVDILAGQLRIEVTDDGAGFDPARARDFLQEGRVGLASMRERVELTNGTFMVHSTAGRGTTVLASLSLSTSPAQREVAVN